MWWEETRQRIISEQQFQIRTIRKDWRWEFSSKTGKKNNNLLYLFGWKEVVRNILTGHVLILTVEKEYKASGFVLHPEYMTQLHVFVNLRYLFEFYLINVSIF